MKTKKAKKQKTILQKSKSWSNAQRGLTAAKLAMPAIPFGVVLGVNWSDWVDGSPTEGWSIGVGFGMLIMATIAAIIGIWKKDEIVKSKVSGILYVALVFLVLGFGFKLMASMMNEMGDMLLYVAIGITASFVVDEVDKIAVAPQVKFYNELVEKNGLSKSAAKKMDDAEQAKLEGEQAKKERVDLT